MIALFGWAVLWKYAGWIIFGCFALWFLVYGIPLLAEALRLRKIRKVIEQQSADYEAMRYQEQLDRENREWLDAGLYEGDYPGYTMPLTREEWIVDPATERIAGSDDSEYWSRIVRPQ